MYAHAGSNIELTCEISPIIQQTTRITSSYSMITTTSTPSTSAQQTYWYFNGNLLNYIKTMTPTLAGQYNNIMDKNFSIEWDSFNQASRFKLFNVQTSDAGNYTCKPTSAEPSTIRLHVKSSYSLTIQSACLIWFSLLL